MECFDTRLEALSESTLSAHNLFSTGTCWPEPASSFSFSLDLLFLRTKYCEGV